MRKTSLATAVIGAAILVSSAAAHAQFFNYNTTFLSNPILTSVSGNQINATNVFNNSGAFAGSFGTDIVTTNFAAVASSATTGVFSGLITEAITLVPTDSLGNPVVGDTAVTHTFTANYVVDLDTNAIVSSMTPLPSPPQTYSFADGSVFTVNLTSYTGPSVPNGLGNGALGAHVNGALSGVLQSTPEPGSVAMLFGMGLSGGVFAYRRRRSRA